MSTIATASVALKLTLDNGKVFFIHEGDVLRDVCYSGKTISGVVRVINAQSKAFSAGSPSCPPEPYAYKYITVGSIVIDSSETFDAQLTTISTNTITDIGSMEKDGGAIIVGPGSQYKPLAQVIEDAEPYSVIELSGGSYEAPLTLNKSVTIRGNGERVNLTGGIQIAAASGSEPIAVVLQDVALTGDALVTVGAGVSTFTMDGVRFGGHNISSKTMPFNFTAAEPLVLSVTNCVFEEEPAGAYNLFEIRAKLATGTTISGNRFEAGCCHHNMISFYDVEEGAVIDISNNWAAESKNLIRIGVKGAPNCTVIMDSNAFDATDEAPWDGLVLVQPYGKETSTFAGLTMIINKTKMPDTCTQVGYVYCNANDQQLTVEQMPKVVIDDYPCEIPPIGENRCAPIGQIVR